MRQDQERSELNDAGPQTRRPGRRLSEDSAAATTPLLDPAGEEESADTHASHADFNRNFDRIFLDGKN